LKNLTLFADASWHDGFAGWGCWMKGDGMGDSITAGGAFEERMHGSNVAELAAIERALNVAKERNLLPRVVMIQSDCTAALTVIKTLYPQSPISVKPGERPVFIPMAKRKKMDRPEIRAITDKLVEHLKGCEIIIRHVKGHQGGKGRAWVNRLCDKIAKEGRRKAAMQGAQVPA
jgi:ribonuclease HI